jgi:hypothetical protein
MIQKTAFWAVHVAALKLEATSASQYAKQHGLAVKSLYYWRRKLAVTKLTHQAETKPIPSVLGNKFVALQVATPRQTHYTLSLPSGLRLEMSVLPGPEWLAAFDRAVQSMPGLR